MRRDDTGKLQPTRGGALWSVQYLNANDHRVTRVVEAWTEKGARRQVTHGKGVVVTRDIHTRAGWGWVAAEGVAWLRGGVSRMWKAWRNNDARPW